MKVSKTIKPGMLCAIRNGKIVRCGKGMKPVGIWAEGLQQSYVVPATGERKNLTIPDRLVYAGECSVLAEKS